eukprot:7231504-Ditylum_brightwellii.AAC.1
MNVWHPPEACPPLTPTAIIFGKRQRQRGGTTMNDNGERLDENGEVLSLGILFNKIKKASDKILMWVYGGAFWVVMPRGMYQLPNVLIF